MMLDGSNVAVDTKPSTGMAPTALATGTGSKTGTSAWTGALPIEPDTQVREYLFIKILGKGGMGEVYLAQHRFTEQHVAIKVLFRNLMRDEQGAQRFVEEARTMAGLRHPNIVQFINFFEELKTYFLVMEYVDGTTLDRALRKGPMPLAEALRIGKGVLAGLEYAYGRPEQVIHRDIKPSNIMLATDDRILIADFGIAKAVGRERLIETRGIIGTVEYMAPEQVKGEAVSPATDIYAFGITLYKMLAGVVPFRQQTDSGIDCMNAHLREPPPDIRALREEIPGWLEQVVGRALAKRPMDRYSSAGEMREALEQGAATFARMAEGPGSGLTAIGTEATLDSREAAGMSAPSPTPQPQAVTARAVPDSPGEEPPDTAPRVTSTRPTLLRRPLLLAGILSVPIILAVVLFVVASAFMGNDKKKGESAVADTREAADVGAVGKKAADLVAEPAAVVKDVKDAARSKDTGGPSPAPEDLNEEAVDVRQAVPDLKRKEPDTGHADAASAAGSPAVPEEMVHIRSGSYPVGCPEGNSNCYEDEKPLRNVDVAAFCIMRYEVTVGEYEACVAEGICPGPGDSRGCNWRQKGRKKHPMNCVDWTGAGAFCTFKGWRLPTEVEWEVAARGKESLDYVWGNDAPTCVHTVMKEGRKRGCGKGGTAPIGSRGPDISRSGVRDMGGNVREWVASKYEPYPGGTIEEDAKGFVNRGGSWMMEKGDFSTIHTRLVDTVDEKRPDLGFRCAVSLE